MHVGSHNTSHNDLHYSISSPDAITHKIWSVQAILYPALVLSVMQIIMAQLCMQHNTKCTIPNLISQDHARQDIWPRVKFVESDGLFVLRFYGPVNPMGSCQAWSVYLTTRLLGRLSLLSS